MLSVFKSCWALLIGMLLIMMGNGLQGTLLGVRGSLEGIGPESMGYIMSGYFIGFLGGSKLTTVMLARVGHVRVFAALGSLASVAFILFPVIVEPWFWFLMRVVVGFSLAGLYVVSESWLNDISTNENRGQVLSIYIMMQMIGIVVGQVLMNADDPAGYHLFILVSVLVSLSFAPILLSVDSAPVFQSAKPMSFKELFIISPLGVVGIFLIGGVFAALFAMASVYATEKGFSVSMVAYFVMCIYIGGMIMQYPIGWLSDKIDRRLLIFAVCLASTVTCLAVYYYEHPYLVWVAAFVVGGTANPLYTLLVSYTNDYLDNSQMASASGSLIFINGVGAMSGPILVGYLMEKVGADGYFLFVAALMAAIGLYGLYRMTQRGTADETSPYLYMPNRTTQIAAEIATEIVIEEIEESENSDDEASTSEGSEVERSGNENNDKAQ